MIDNRLRRVLAVFFAVLTLALCTQVPSIALAQQQVLISGTLDGGVRGTILPVAVDAYGRVLISNPGGGGSGSSTAAIYPIACVAASPHKFTSVGTSSTAVPSTAASGRYYTRICVTLEATGTPQLKCRTDGVAPAFGASPGEVLSAGDCVTYSLSSASNILCIANAASTPVSTFECQ